MSIHYKSAALGVGATSVPQLLQGPGEVLALAIDFNAAANANADVTFYDGFSTASRYPAIFTSTDSATDFGTTVPQWVFGNGRLISGVSTNNVKAGLPFFDGLYVDVVQDVTGPQTIHVWYRDLVKKSGNISTTGTAGTAAGSTTLFSGAGILHAARVIYDLNVPNGTNDIQLYDGISTAGRALTVQLNSSANWAASADTSLVVTTNRDEASTAVTTAANAHENPGIPIRTGVTVGLAQSNALEQAASVDILMEV